MSLTDIKTKNQGFTIVELLIVVVVIAILAAITIVSYNGITNRANASAAQSTAAAVQKKAEAFNAEKSQYPSKLEDLTGASSGDTWYLTGVNNTSPNSAAFNVAPTSSNGKNTVQYVPCGYTSVVNTTTAPANQTGGTATTRISVYTGAQVIYYNFSGNTTTVNVGQTSQGYTVTAGSDVRTVGCPQTV